MESALVWLLANGSIIGTFLAIVGFVWRVSAGASKVINSSLESFRALTTLLSNHMAHDEQRAATTIKQNEIILSQMERINEALVILLERTKKL